MWFLIALMSLNICITAVRSHNNEKRIKALEEKVSTLEKGQHETK